MTHMPRPARAPAPRTIIPLPNGIKVPKPWRVLHVIGLMLAVPACGVPRPEMRDPDISALDRQTVTLEALRPSVEEPVTVSYLQGGDPESPRVIYVHGTPGAATGWADYLAPGQTRFHAISLDRPGFGESGPERGAVTSLEAQAAALLPFLEKQGGAKPILVGHSLGGPIVARAAVDHPDKIGGLVIAAGSLDPNLEKIHPLQRFGEWPLVRSLLPRAIRNANRELIALEPELAALAVKLGEVDLPVVIVHGTEDDLVPFENVAFMENRFTGTDRLEIVVLEGVNHFLPWNSKPSIDAAVLRVTELMGPR